MRVFKNFMEFLRILWNQGRKEGRKEGKGKMQIRLIQRSQDQGIGRERTDSGTTSERQDRQLRERERERPRARLKDRQTDKTGERERERDRQTDRQT